MDICNYRNLTHKEIISILDSKIICSLGTSANDKVNIVPMWYIFEEDDKNLTIFFIFTNSNNDVNNIKNNENVCILLDNYISNFYRDAYQTVIAKGKAEIMTNLVQKNFILNKFMRKYHKSVKDFGCRDDLEYVEVCLTCIEGRDYNYE